MSRSIKSVVTLTKAASIKIKNQLEIAKKIDKILKKNNVQTVSLDNLKKFK